MRGICCLTLLLCLPSTILADDMSTTAESQPSPPSYKVLRFDENYSYLANPANRTDLLDPLKYIPLLPDDSTWYLTLGGELRERFEGTSNPDFGLAGSHDSYWLQRTTLFGDLHLGEHLRFFAEGISGLQEYETLPRSPVQYDPLGLQFAFIDFIPYSTKDNELTLRAGRFGMSLGSGRLVATRAAPNIPFKFDGVEVLNSSGLWESTAFFTRPVKEAPDLFNSDITTTRFWGAYLTRYFDAQHKQGLDLYYLGIANEHGIYASGAGKELRHSFGTRLFGEKDQWDWNAEAVLQTGTFGSNSILAWTASLDSGYTFEEAMQPRLGLKVDVASGDRNPTDGQQGTFDALYFKSGYFNDASLLRPANIIDVHPNLGANLTKTLSVNGGADVFWRYSKNDAIYNPAGMIAVPALSNASSYVGTALDVNFVWQIQRHVTLGLSYVHFFSGSYIHSAGGRDLNYLSTTLSVLF